MFKPKELIIAATAATGLTLSGISKVEALSTRSEKIPAVFSPIQNLPKKLKDIRIAQYEVAQLPGTIYNPEAGRREWIPNYQQVTYMAGDILETDLQYNCNNVEPGSVYSGSDGADTFYCRVNSPDSPNGAYWRPLSKNHLCNNMALNNFQYFVNSRNLGGDAQFLGGRAEDDKCWITIGTTQYNY